MDQNNRSTLDKDYWDTRWQTGDTGWDTGAPSPALIDYMKIKVNKNAAILIPGCGNAYEATALTDLGFENITLIDISPIAAERARKQFGNRLQVYCVDFFVHSGAYDIILEQTFFCALSPDLRPAYVSKMQGLLKTDGILTGVLFASEFNNEGPPFGGTAAEYKKHFQPFFNILHLEKCRNSIPPRAGNELFFELKKR